MKVRLRGPLPIALGVPAIMLVLAVAAQAGPPLICHPIQIGQAKSLPWTSGNWNLSGSEKYDLKRLVGDTLAILDSNTPVIVRMETLRRATLYTHNDLQVAKELLARLHARATSAETAGHPDALAWFDAGYLAESYKQWIGKDQPNPAAGIDGYAWVKRAISLRGKDPQIEFAAALITIGGPAKDCQKHAQKSIAGAKTDPLLAQNLATHFMGKQGKTVSEMFARELR